MSVEGLLKLPDDVVLTPVDALPAETLERLEHQAGDYALTRPQSRAPSRIVSAETAKLLEVFREPVSIVEAVIRFSAAGGRDARETLEESFPVLRALANAGLLLSPESELARPIELSWKRDDRVGDLRIVEPIDVVLDTEVYLVRTADGAFAALKMARGGAEARLQDSFAHEAAILRQLGGRCGPRLVALGQADGRPYLAVEWIRGVDANIAAAVARGRGPANRAELAGILKAVAEAYARLHAEGIVHGDIHPRNLLIDGLGRAVLIDFGHARDLRSDGPPRGRGVIDLYMEPELARARRHGVQPPEPCEAGEQYCLAALLYFLATGAHTHDFVLEPEEMLRQVLEEPPLPFAARGVDDLPSTEGVLLRALDNEPARRFASVTEMAAALGEALTTDGAERRLLAKRVPELGQTILDEVIERTALSGALMAAGLEAPSASVNNGAAGLAYALMRIAQRRDDGEMLAAAEVWAGMAASAVIAAPREALSCPEMDLAAEVVGEVSLFHAAPGVHCVRALIAQACGDEEQRGLAVEEFVQAAARREPWLELAFGSAGALVGCAILLDAGGASEEGAMLRDTGDALSHRIMSEQRALGDLATATGLLGAVGAAHGWTGILYALLLWARSSGSAPAVEERLVELAALARPCGRGLTWPVKTGPHAGGDGLRASWCNGAAGMTHLWSLAHEIYGDAKYAELARGAAWTAYEAPTGGGDLCCGLAGRAYAALRLFRLSGDELWVDRAWDLAERAARDIRAQPQRPNSLYKGELGLALLLADLEQPDQARMPLFETEGWR